MESGPANAVQMEGWQGVTEDEELFPGLDDRAQGGSVSTQPQPGERDGTLVGLVVSDRAGISDCLDVVMCIKSSLNGCMPSLFRRPQSACPQELNTPL